MTIDRRSLLGLLGAGVALPVDAAAPPPAPALSFAHGVASGDPTTAGAILWTRITPADPAHAAPVPLTWHVADGDRVIASGRAEARASRDWTVKAEPKTLKPGAEYRYWFEAGRVRSPEGRLRTLPTGATPDAVFAVVTCSLYTAGFFNAYRVIAELPRVDAVVHLGDYIYEYGQDGYGGAIGMKIGRLVEPPREVVTLADYRARHAHYKADPDLQAAHARAAMIAVWDDHETANDSWVGGAENHQPATEGNWSKRKAAALQAYFEWMPIRDPLPGKPWAAINRSFQFGDLATLAMVETRLLARAEQTEIQKHTDAAFYAEAMKRQNDPSREMLGEPQRRWLEGVLTASVKAGTPWQVLGNQVVMARVVDPVIDLARVPDTYRANVAAAEAARAAGLPSDLDGWNGYPFARERLYASLRRAGSRPLVLSGDSHAFWANQLHDEHGVPVGAELGTSAITSPSIGDVMPDVPVGRMLEEANPEVLFCDQRAKGFILLTLTPDRARAEYWAVSTVMAKQFERKTLVTYEVRAGDPSATLRRV